MESLLDNPMKAVLYLKELTTIVQNQQSLIQTQRQRIDELERKVEELIGENRNLKDKPQPQTYHYHHHPSQRSTSPQPPAHLHQYPASKATAIVAASTPLTAQLQPPQQHQQPLIPPQQPQTPEHPLPETQPQKQLQLVPASPPNPLSPQCPQPSRASPEPVEAEKKTPCCKSLVPQKPAAICRAVVLGRKPNALESQSLFAHLLYLFVARRRWIDDIMPGQARSSPRLHFLALRSQETQTN
ncbi:UNVERIFIED_CONTAM: hypothetical protein FKN15_063460 [Acipenser sinensis]